MTARRAFQRVRCIEGTNHYRFVKLRLTDTARTHTERMRFFHQPPDRGYLFALAKQCRSQQCSASFGQAAGRISPTAIRSMEFPPRADP